MTYIKSKCPPNLENIIGLPSEIGNAYEVLEVNTAEDALEYTDSPRNIGSINFNTSAATPTYTEGNINWNSNDKTLDIQTGSDDVTLQVGQEFLIRVHNDTGSTISNGTAVYINGVNGGSGRPTINLADAHENIDSKAAGITTEEIIDGADGFVTRIGLVRELNTSALTTGPIYLSDTVPGGLMNTKPTDGGFTVSMGQCLVSDATAGVLLVWVNASELTVEVTDTNGFPGDQRSNTDMSIIDGTGVGARTFTIEPVTGTIFHYYVLGIKYEKTGAQTIVIPDTEGIHVIYYDMDTLSMVSNPNDGQVDDIIRTTAIVAYLYWDATNKKHVYFGDERHGISMSPETHSYLHFTQGSKWLTGIAPGDIIADGGGSLDSHAQFSTTAGRITDEDLQHTLPAIAVTTGLHIYYLDGASGNLRLIQNSGFSVLDDITAGVGSTGRLVFNEFTGGAWQLSTVTSGNCVLCHVFATNALAGAGHAQTVALIGQAEYTNKTLARDAAETEIGNILTAFPSPEITPIATIIFQTKDSYTNSINARIISTDAGEDYVDWRTTVIVSSSSSSSHNSLSGLELAGVSSTWGHIDDQTQIIAGVKKFSSVAEFYDGTNTDEVTATELAFPSQSTSYDYTIPTGMAKIVQGPYTIDHAITADGVLNIL